jgi:[ribosomal protein S18]-alanine N-acetyltransferase
VSAGDEQRGTGLAAPPLRTREAGAADLDAVVALEAQTFHNPWSRKAFEDELRTPYASLVLAEAEPGGELVGFVDYWVVHDELHLLSVAVAPERQRQYIGRFLVDLAEGDGRERGADYALLEVRVGNVPARALYGLSGYREIGRRKRYYRDTGEDALVMMKFLGGEA